MTARKIVSVTHIRCAAVNSFGNSPKPMVVAVWLMKEKASKIPIRSGLPWASRPGMSDSPSTLTAKITMRTIKGIRTRRSTRNTPADERFGLSAGRGRLATMTSSAALEGDGLDHKEHHRNHVGEQRTTGERHHGGRLFLGDRARADHVRRVGPYDRSSDQLEAGDQAGRQVHRPYLGAVAELQHGRNQIDHDRREELVHVVKFGVAQVADEEPEVQCGR